MRVTQRQDWTKQDVENPGATGNSPAQTTVTVQQGSSSSRSPLRFLLAIVFSLISLGFLAIFVLALVNKGSSEFLGTDWPHPPTILWIIYEALNAAVPAMYLAYYWVCFPVGIFNLTSMIANIWSIVYIVLIYIAKDDVAPLYDSNIMIVVYMSMASTVYHSLLARYFVKKGSSTTGGE